MKDHYYLHLSQDSSWKYCPLPHRCSKLLTQNIIGLGPGATWVPPLWEKDLWSFTHFCPGECDGSWHLTFIFQSKSYVVEQLIPDQINAMAAQRELPTRYFCPQDHCFTISMIQHDSTFTLSSVVPTSVEHRSISSELRRWVEVMPNSSKYFSKIFRCPSENTTPPVCTMCVCTAKSQMFTFIQTPK